MLMFVKTSVLTLFVLAAAEAGASCGASPEGCTATSGDAEKDPNTLLQTRASIGEADEIAGEGGSTQDHDMIGNILRQNDEIAKFWPAAKAKKCAEFNETEADCPKGCKWSGTSCDAYAWTKVPGMFCHSRRGVHRNVKSPQDCQDFCREGCMGIAYTAKYGGACIECSRNLESVIPDKAGHGLDYYPKEDDYTVGSPQVQGCLPGWSPITTEAECKEAMKAIGKTFSLTGSFSNGPQGCLLHRGLGYFNQNPETNGISTTSQVPVCKKG